MHTTQTNIVHTHTVKVLVHLCLATPRRMPSELWGQEDNDKLCKCEVEEEEEEAVTSTRRDSRAWNVHIT